eukprot:3990-Rhodomonas_salina.2
MEFGDCSSVISQAARVSALLGQAKCAEKASACVGIRERCARWKSARRSGPSSGLRVYYAKSGTGIRVGPVPT